MARRALVIGISEYQRASSNLLYAAKDAEEIAKVLESLGFDVDLRVNSHATVTGIGARMDALKASLTEEDTFVFFFAGHGFATRTGLNYLELWDFEPQYHETTAFNLTETLDVFGSSNVKCQRIIFFVDACHSGTGAPTARGDTESLQLENVLAQAEHCALFASCKMDQKSYESNEYRHGLFTYYLLKALTAEDADAREDGTTVISSKSLQDYLSRKVPQAARALKPQARDQQPIFCGVFTRTFLIANVASLLALRQHRSKIAASITLVAKTRRFCEVRASANFNKRSHTIQKKWSPSARDFALRMCAEEIGEFTRARKEAIRKSFGLNRRNADISEVPSGGMTIIAAGFRYDLEFDIYRDDCNLVYAEEQLSDLTVATLQSTALQEVFRNKLRTIRLLVSGDIEIDEVKDTLDDKGLGYDEEEDDCVGFQLNGTFSVSGGMIEFEVRGGEVTPQDVISSCLEGLEKSGLSVLVDIGDLKALVDALEGRGS